MSSIGFHIPANIGVILGGQRILERQDSGFIVAKTDHDLLSVWETQIEFGGHGFPLMHSKILVRTFASGSKNRSG